jgi:hypothetical protein
MTRSYNIEKQEKVVLGDNSTGFFGILFSFQEKKR